MRSTEFDGVFLDVGRERPIFSRSPRVKATKYLEDKINDESPVPIPDDSADDVREALGI